MASNNTNPALTKVELATMNGDDSTFVWVDKKATLAKVKEDHGFGGSKAFGVKKNGSQKTMKDTDKVNGFASIVFVGSKVAGGQ